MNAPANRTMRQTVVRPPRGRYQSLYDIPAEKWRDWFLLSAGAILSLAGVEQIAVAVTKRVALGFSDPIIGVQFWYVLTGFGIISLLVAGICLFAQQKWVATGFVLWWSANIAFYWIGLWQMGWAHPYPFVACLVHGWHVPPPVAGVIQASVTGYLLGGSVWVTVMLRRGMADRKFLKTFCPTCGGHIRFAIQNIGEITSCPHCAEKVTLRGADETLKISCYFCQGHIEFPAHALGTKMPCPHCRKDIKLVEPRREMPGLPREAS